MRQVMFHRTTSSGGRSDAARDASRQSTGDDERAALTELCYQALTELCRQVASAAGVPPATVMNMQALRTMAERLPTTRDQMLAITHVTVANFAKYGARLLEAIAPYAQQDAARRQAEEARRSADPAAGAAQSTPKPPAKRRRKQAATPAAKRARTGAIMAKRRAQTGGAASRGRVRAGGRTAVGPGLLAAPQPRSFLAAAPRVSHL